MVDVLKIILGNALEDIVLTGFVDTQESPIEFVPLLNQVNLVIGTAFVKIQREDDCSLTISIVQELSVPRVDDEGFSPCRSSIGKYVLTDPHSDNRIATILEYLEPRTERMLAIEFVTESGQSLFFDPLYHDGINFGGAEQKATWQRNSKEYLTRTWSKTD